MKTKTKPKICADCGETWRRDPSPMVIDETWRAIGCEPQTMLYDMCLSSNYGWLRPGADPDDIVPLFDPPHRSVAQIGAVKEFILIAPPAAMLISVSPNNRNTAAPRLQLQGETGEGAGRAYNVLAWAREQLVIFDELGQVRGPRSPLYEALETAIIRTPS